MDWHSINATKDDDMRILVDSLAFKHINQKWLDFKIELRTLNWEWV